MHADFVPPPRRLRPARDAGLRLNTREERRLAREKRLKLQIILIASSLCLALFLAGFIWMQESEHFVATVSRFNDEAISAESTTIATNAATLTASENSIDGLDALPTPIIASFGEIAIHLPVDLDALTEVAFHPANYSYAMKLSTHMPEAELAETKAQKSTGRDIRTQNRDEGAMLVGKCLKLWRSGRKTNVMTAVDVGAAPGSPVIASIDGTVTAVKKYRFEDKVDDYEVHIASSVLPGIEQVVIHIQDIVVVEGDGVVAGMTQIGSVRNIAKYTRPQLAAYAGKKGNHVHIQINDTRTAAYINRQKTKPTTAE